MKTFSGSRSSGGEDAGDGAWAQATDPSWAAYTADVSMTKATWLGNLASVAVAAMFRPAFRAAGF